MSLFVKPLLDRRRVIAIIGGVIAAAAVAALVAGREFVRVRDIMLSIPSADVAVRDMTEQRMIVAIVILSAAGAAFCLCLALAVARPNAHAPIVGCLTPLLAFAAVLPVYQFVYHGVPPGWHINIAEEYRWAQPAGVVAGLLAYAVVAAGTIRK
jgi:hypothetical protein